MFAVGLGFLFFAVAVTTVQAAEPPPLDPLIQLMISQPPIELATQIAITAAFDPPVVRLGEESTYRVSFNALEDSIRWPEALAAPPQLQLRPSARGQMFVPVPGKMEPRTVINHRVRASAVGSYEIPEFEVPVYRRPIRVPAARLEVVAPNTPEVPTPARLELEMASTNVYLGQRVRARVLMTASASNTVEVLSNVRLNGDGFLVDAAAVHQTIGMRTAGGRTVATYVYETVLTPLVAGALTVSAQGFTAGNRFSGPITIQGQAAIPGGPPQYLLLDSDPVALRVRPLPGAGELPGFTGAIGQFTCERPELSTNTVRAGDLLKLLVTFRSAEEFGRFVPPPPPTPPGWQVFDAVPAPVPPANRQPLPGIPFTFAYSLIPLTDGADSTPAIPFSCFDPERGAYVDLTIPSVPVTVLPRGGTAGEQAWPASSQAAVPGEKKPALSELAAAPGRTVASLRPLQQRGWFVGLQLLPLAGLAGLWFWDRRRRFLEAHPGIVLRRRARRALRREWRALQQAWQAGDAPRFAAGAVRAMQAACAPQYPAEPRALVCGDVLAVLEQSGPPGAEAVRRFFAAADAAEFSGAATDAAGLLALRPELERVLEELEAKL